MASSLSASQTTAPYGSWTSPITSDVVSGASKRLGGTAVDAHGHLIWLESRPNESGRAVLVKEPDEPGDEPVDITPKEFAVRTVAQEYGGGAFKISGDSLIFSNYKDQRLYKQSINSKDSSPVPLTPDYGAPVVSYADGVFDSRFNRYVTVKEDRRESSLNPTTTIVSVGLDDKDIQEPQVLVSGNDFYAFPRMDPKGERIAWIECGHPNMPWDKSEVWVGYISENGDVYKRVCVAGCDPNIVESPTEPKWSSKGELFFITDRKGGFWNLYKWIESDNKVLAVYSLDAEFARPLCVFGMNSYEFIQNHEEKNIIACSYRQNGRSYLGILDDLLSSFSLLDIPFTDIDNITAGNHCLYVEGASAVHPSSVAKVTLDDHQSKVVDFKIVWSSSPDSLKYKSYFSLPELIEFPTEVPGQNAYAYFYPPSNPMYQASREEKPPLLLKSHGGPTSETRGMLNLSIQYWTSRGWAFVDVNYGGSTDRAAETTVSNSLIDRIYGVFADGIHFATPISSLRTNEVDLVRGVLQMLQGFSSSLFYWDHSGESFRARSGIYVTHLSHTSLHVLLNQFIYVATCLKLVEIVQRKVETSVRSSPPTLRAFSCSVTAWLKRLRAIALKEETKISNSDVGITPTLLGLASSLSSLCSGAENLMQIVHGAVPQVYFEPSSSVPAAEIAVHVLDHLYKKLDEACLVQGGEEEAYQMLLHIFVGSLLPCIEGLDSWLFEGTLDDPFEEMFFYANREISVDEAEFWEKSYLLRLVQRPKLDVEPSGLTTASGRVPLTNDKKEMGERESISTSGSVKGKEQNNGDLQVCPLFIKDIAKSIVSAGKSLQLIRHVPSTLSVISCKNSDSEIDGFRRSNDDSDLSKCHHGQIIAGLTLSEIFCVSLAGLIGHGDHICRYFWQDDRCKSKINPLSISYLDGKMVENGNGETLPALTCSEKIWYKFLVDTLSQKGVIDSESAHTDARAFPYTEENISAGVVDALPIQRSFCPENPVITVCQRFLNENRNAWKTLNLSRNFNLPPLNDDVLRKAVFGMKSEPFSGVKGTDYTFGFQFGESEYLRSQDDTKLLEILFPFPTLLPSFQDDVHMSELLSFQKNSTLPSRVLAWIQSVEPRTTLPVVIIQECLTVYIKKQVDYIGRLILSKLMNDWRLMDELAVLRAIYLLGSGDLLQHFLTVIFSKLDKGESWDDDFELNTTLQESIRNSADGMLLSAPDSLVVSITKNHGSDGDEQPSMVTLGSTPHKSRGQSFGIDGLDSLKFTYKVSWPLELIANAEAIKKYNQVMGFLLKVKRAKFVLDKARRWMWKGRGTGTNSRKRHWLVEQKLLHFVDAFHQYVMDRVYHSAWRELCEGMATAGSLDEVIEVHEAYLLSIQRQCFVVPDKLWALIASRINSILGLALDFHSIQQTLSSGGAVSAIKARCEMELDRIEKQFDDCIAFLLRVLSFKLNVGHFPHLADLVTRINYNYFYMSDSGNLMTAPGSETVTARLGKSYASRTD